MCIRDRKNTTFGREPAEDTSGHWVYAMLRHDARARATVLVVGNLSPNINFYNPVSYTHLDVYKRQVKERALHPLKDSTVIIGS